MRTSNPLLLAEVDVLEGVLRVDANDLVVVMELDKLTEENARLREVLKGIENISTSTPDKQHNDITIGDVSLMDNALQSIFEIAYKIRLKGDEDE